MDEGDVQNLLYVCVYMYIYIGGLYIYIRTVYAQRNVKEEGTACLSSKAWFLEAFYE
jgi:hypothetical protein